ncbi:zinc finger protein [Anaeramoeba flamelloides]|uniref:Zinc finger protein n=1 Tax=Anaeramoeba flamelloides TaxID=1746091 RepID=A0AAV7YX68_9EUKA|nr:zinc finger protein [Anaeramoeba flamelloides]
MDPNFYLIFNKLGIYLYKTHVLEKEIDFVCSRNAFEKTYPTQNQKQLEKYLIQISVIFEQIGILIKPTTSLSLIKNPYLESFECFLNPNWKRTFERINGRSLNPSQNTKKRRKRQTREEKTIAMLGIRSVHQLTLGPKNRDQISKNTKFAKQRICVVLSILKGIGLVKENTTKKRSLFLNTPQIYIITNTLYYNLKTVELRKKRRNLQNKGINLLNQLTLRIKQSNANFDEAAKFEEKKLLLYKSIFSKKEKFETKIETTKNPTIEIIKNIKKPTNGTIERIQRIQKILQNTSQDNFQIKNEQLSQKSQIMNFLTSTNPLKAKFKLEQLQQQICQSQPQEVQQQQPQEQHQLKKQQQLRLNQPQQEEEQQQRQQHHQIQFETKNDQLTNHKYQLFPFPTTFKSQIKTQFQQHIQGNQNQSKSLSREYSTLQYNRHIFPPKKISNISNFSQILPTRKEKEKLTKPNIQGLNLKFLEQNNKIIIQEKESSKEKKKSKEKENDHQKLYQKLNHIPTNYIRNPTSLFVNSNKGEDITNKIASSTYPSIHLYPQLDFPTFLKSISPIPRSPAMTLFDDENHRVSPWTFDPFLNNERTAALSEPNQSKKIKSEPLIFNNLAATSPFFPNLRFSPYLIQQDQNNKFQQSISPLQFFNPELFEKVQKEIAETQKRIKQQQQSLQQQQQQQQKQPQQQTDSLHFHLLDKQLKQQIQIQLPEKPRINNPNTIQNGDIQKKKKFECENIQESHIQPKFIPKISEDWFK